jgi:hypothetical protein
MLPSLVLEQMAPPRTMRFFAVALIAMLALAAVCGPIMAQDLTSEVDLDTAMKVEDYYSNWLSSIPGVTGVSVDNNQQGEPEIVVNASEMTPEMKNIPPALNGIPVTIKLPTSPTEGQSEPAPTPIVPQAQSQSDESE